MYTDMVAVTGTYVVTLEATDNDAAVTPGGQVKYRFRTGSVDDFTIDSVTGVVTVGDNARLDYITKPLYNITVC